MITQKDWKEFRDSGLLWFINSTLHLFGWAIVLEIDYKDNIINAYPARVKFRGFDEQTNKENYQKISDYLERNIIDLADESYGI